METLFVMPLIAIPKTKKSSYPRKKKVPKFSKLQNQSDMMKVKELTYFT